MKPLDLGAREPVTKDQAMHRLVVALSAYMGVVGYEGNRVDKHNAGHLFSLAKSAISEAATAAK